MTSDGRHFYIGIPAKGGIGLGEFDERRGTLIYHHNDEVRETAEWKYLMAI